MRFVRCEYLGKPRYGKLEGEQIHLLSGAPWQDGTTEQDVSLVQNTTRLLVPCEPSKIVAVGRNYAAHAAEHFAEVPSEPLLFLKAPSALLPPLEPIVLTPLSNQVEFEAELALVIGRRCRHVDAAEALSVIFGYTCANDVTARDLQRKDGQWARAKSFDTFCPLGPWIETDFDAEHAEIVCRVENEVRQKAKISDLVFGIGQLIAHISRVMTLEAGDVILTGTPAGVGRLEAGHFVEVVISGLGTLGNPVIAAT